MLEIKYIKVCNEGRPLQSRVFEVVVGDTSFTVEAFELIGDFSIEFCQRRIENNINDILALHEIRASFDKLQKSIPDFSKSKVFRDLIHLESRIDSRLSDFEIDVN